MIQPAEPSAATTRQGPRPLPYHLMAQATSLLSSCAALPLWKSGSVGLKLPPAMREAELRRQIAHVDAAKFHQALSDETLRRVDDFLAGIKAYRGHPYRRALEAMPVVWQQGSSRLLDYGAPGASGPPILVVPSLINRSYILDLTTQRSLLRRLRAKGLRPYLIDWDVPGEAERGFGVEAYVVERLAAALDHVLTVAGPPVVLGYCMGGLLALALASIRQQDLRGLVLLATPWDFHRPNRQAADQLQTMALPMQDMLAQQAKMPADLLQILFSLQDPGTVERKFRQFADLPRNSAAARNFVAVEDWVNDCVPLTAEVAKDTLFGWYVANRPALGEWRIAGRVVAPQNIKLPALVMMPAKDRIVPTESAMPLTELLPKAERRVVEGGHVGMLIGARAVTEIYGVIAKSIITMNRNGRSAH